MKRILFSLTVFSLLAMAWSCAARDPQTRLVARGKYIVENVGMCADCHSPRNERGEYIQERWLQGSLLAFAPTVQMPVWAGAAPAIAGLPGISEADAVKLLETGTTGSGVRKRPPMPDFRLSHEDATAVVAYLKSLK